MALLTRDQLDNANLDLIHLAELILGVNAAGQAVNSSTDREGNTKLTLSSLLRLFARENPIGTYTGGLTISRSTQTVNFDAGSGVQLWSWNGVLPHTTTGLADDFPGTNPNWLSVLPANLGTAALEAATAFFRVTGGILSGDVAISKVSPNFTMATPNATNVTITLTGPGANALLFRLTGSTGHGSIIHRVGGAEIEILRVENANPFFQRSLTIRNGAASALNQFDSTEANGFFSSYSVAGATLTEGRRVSGTNSNTAVTQLTTGIKTNSVAQRGIEPVDNTDYAIKSYVDARLITTGTIVLWAGSTAPSGFFEMRGQTFNAASFPALNTILGGNTIPDMRGEVPRGWDNGRGVDSGRVRLSSQLDALQGHAHFKILSTSAPGIGDGSAQTPILGNTERTSSDGSVTTDGTDTSFGAARVASETRGRNVAVMIIIKN